VKEPLVGAVAVAGMSPLIADDALPGGCPVREHDSWRVLPARAMPPRGEAIRWVERCDILS